MNATAFPRSRATEALINVTSLEHNLACIRRCAPQSAVLAMVKANAYGHGIQRVALALPSADGFGVACLMEALALREAGIQQRIVLLEGFFRSSELPLIAKYQLDTVVHDEQQLRILETAKTNKQITVWLKINTGMNRLGFSYAQIQNVWSRLQACKNVKKPIHLMTHFSDADDLSKLTTLKQIQLFNEVTQGLPGWRSLANSAGIMAWPDAHADWVRPGIMLYGVAPFPNKTGADFGLKPVMTLCSELIAVHQLKAGETVGYGSIWVCPEAMPVGVVAIGYGDGYPRHAKQGTPVLVNGQRVPLIGRISMDMLAVDLRSIPESKPGDPAVLWGEGLPVEEIAQWADTIPYELLCGMAQRVNFRIVQGRPAPVLQQASA